jgi:propanol-preferring alcohol dehydrogenase
MIRVLASEPASARVGATATTAAIEPIKPRREIIMAANLRRRCKETMTMTATPHMLAMELHAPAQALGRVERAIPRAGPGEVLIKVGACGVCRTDLHVIDGDIQAHHPIVPGHEIVGRVVELGKDVDRFAIGDRVGVPWLARSCGTCRFCRAGQENLCDTPLFTGFDRDGGFATHAVADADFCLALPHRYSDVEAAPLLCAGLIGYRSLKRARPADRVGLYGFGAAAHIIAQVAVHQGRTVFAFTRPGDAEGQAFARGLGCAWAGGSDQDSPEPLDAAIIFAPVGALVPAALRQVRKGGRVVCAGIHMSDIPAFPYRDLWGEREIVSVANLTRADGEEFMSLANGMKIATHCRTYPLARANDAIADVRAGSISGAAVLVP